MSATNGGPPPGRRGEWLSALHAGLAVGVVVVHADKGPLYLNEAGEDLLGRTLGELREEWAANDPPAFWSGCAGRSPDNRPHPALRAMVSAGAVRGSGLHLTVPDGGTRVVEVAARRVGKTVVCTLVDLSLFAPVDLGAWQVELRSAQLDAATVRREARTDPLTGLLNRRGFEEALGRVRGRADRDGGHYGIVAVDLNDFKPVNDRLGHDAGDEVLRRVAMILQRSTRVWDKLARVGGDEFLLLLPDVDAEVLHAVAGRVRDNLQVKIEGLTVTASVGAAMGGPGGEADPLAGADAAMYANKVQMKAGRGETSGVREGAA